MPRILFLNRSYWPDAEATGQLLTELCEDLAQTFEVTVIAGQPNQNPDNAEYCRHGRQSRHGVTVQRVRHTQFGKQRLLGRLTNYVTFLLMATWAALTSRRPDIIVVETDPPLLCLLGALLRRLFGCQLVVYLQDIYPDVAVALGKLSHGRSTALLRRLFFHVYKTADRVIVLSEDMRDLLLESDVPAESIMIIPNWVDTQRLVPIKTHNAFRRRHALEDRFVVMYSGNLGLAQRLEDVLAAAQHLQSRSDIVLVLIGDGASRQQLESLARDRGLANVRFLDYQPKSQLAQSLSAADLHLVPLDSRVTRYLMPSKIYGILASGSPMLVVAPADCELSRLTLRERVGLVVPNQSPAAIAERIAWCADHWARLLDMGDRARQLAVAQYDRRRCTGQFKQQLLDLSLGKRRPIEAIPEPSAPTV